MRKIPPDRLADLENCIEYSNDPEEIREYARELTDLVRAGRKRERDLTETIYKLTKVENENL